MVRFDLDGLEVFFPYDFVYPEQYAYMRQLKASLEAKGHSVLEMPTGTGKTVAIFSLVTSYQLAHPELEKFLFCTRTVAEMEKALVELRGVLRYRHTELVKDQDLDRLKRAPSLGVALSARRNLCVHPRVSRESDREKIDEQCRLLTAPWVRRKESAATEGVAIEDLDADTCKLCPWYESLDKYWAPDIVPPDIYTVDELRRFGQTGCNPVSLAASSNPARVASVIDGEEKGPIFCPYFAARRLAQQCGILVLNYQYVLDPKVAQIAMGGSNLFSSKGQIMLGNSRFTASRAALGSSNVISGGGKAPQVIVFDEAHNIDNVCIEALSINIGILDLERCRGNLRKLEQEVRVVKGKDRERLMDEYKRLLQNLYKPDSAEDVNYEAFLQEHMASPLLPEEQKLLETAMPGNIRKAEIFLIALQKVVHYLDSYIRQFNVVSEGPLTFLRNLEEKAKIESSSLKFFYERLKSLFIALQITNLEEFIPIAKVADFCTLIGNYWKGFIIITDPYPEAPGIYDPVIQLCCLDSSLAMKPVLDNFQSVVLTSGTISPLTLYPKLLAFEPVITQSFPMSLDRKCLCPLVVAKGPDQAPLSSKYELRTDVTVLRNYGRLLIDFSKTIPDGVVCFFTSYAYMEIVVSHWYKTGVLSEVMRYKLIMMESKDIVSTTIALDNYRRCCDSGRGAVFFSVARGKVAEGIDFDRHYGRAVILFGVPFQYTLSRVLKARLDFLRESYGVAENEFLSFDAMRQAAQCVGRVIRSKSDYGLMVFADYRYGKTDKKQKMPEWILTNLDQSHSALSVDTAAAVARHFLLEMSQPYKQTMKSRLDQQALNRLAQLSKTQQHTQPDTQHAVPPEATEAMTVAIEASMPEPASQPVHGGFEQNPPLSEPQNADADESMGDGGNSDAKMGTFVPEAEGIPRLQVSGTDSNVGATTESSSVIRLDDESVNLERQSLSMDDSTVVDNVDME